MPARQRPSFHPALLPSFDLLEHLEDVYKELQKNKVEPTAKQKLLDLSVAAFKALGFTTGELTSAIHAAYQEVGAITPIAPITTPISPVPSFDKVVAPVRTSTPPVTASSLPDAEEKPKVKEGFFGSRK